jgi:rod shape determining protein RodA
MVISIITLKYGVVTMLVVDALSLLGLLYFFRKKKFNPNLLFVIIIHVGIAIYALGVNTVYMNVFKDYQRARIDYVLGKYKKDKKKPAIQEVVPVVDKNAKKERKFDDWNVRQSMIAIGSGGILGKGFLKGTQTRFSFVPEQTTDFIFCTIGEEEGFWGTSLILILYILLLYRLINTADKQRSTFSRIYGYSVAGILFIHFMINIGMTIGIVPVIGIPLPFISYGGSSLLAFTLLLIIMVKLDADRLHVLR